MVYNLGLVGLGAPQHDISATMSGRETAGTYFQKLFVGKLILGELGPCCEHGVGQVPHLVLHGTAAPK